MNVWCLQAMGRVAVNVMFAGDGKGCCECVMFAGDGEGLL